MQRKGFSFAVALACYRHASVQPWCNPSLDWLLFSRFRLLLPAPSNGVRVRYGLQGRKTHSRDSNRRKIGALERHDIPGFRLDREEITVERRRRRCLTRVGLRMTETVPEIDRTRLIDLAGELVKIPSFVPDETAVAFYLRDFFTERGYDVLMQEVEPGRFQTIATLRGAGSGRSLMFNGHMDINSLMIGGTRDPWTPTVEGDRLYGHGIQNMKGGVATMIEAAESIRLAEIELAGDLVVACVVGETQGGVGAKHLVDSGFRTDAAVITEPFGLGKIITVHGGIMHFSIHTHGLSAHISRAKDTVNAVVKMAKVVEALQDVEFTYTPSEDLPALPLINVGSIIGGRGEGYILTEPPYIPDLCTIIVDVHFAPGQTAESVEADIRKVLDALAAEDPDFNYEFELPAPEFFRGRRELVVGPVDIPVDEPIVLDVARNHERVTGGPPDVIGATLPMSYSAGDTYWLWEAGIPSLHYGPGGGFEETGPEGAYISVSEMVTIAEVLALTAMDFCGTA